MVKNSSLVSLGKPAETNMSLSFSVGSRLVHAPDHCLRPLCQATLALNTLWAVLVCSAFHGCSSHAFKEQGRRASRHSSNNNYFISPEHHTQLQMAETEVSHFNENFISHAKHCLRIPGVSSALHRPRHIWLSVKGMVNCLYLGKITAWMLLQKGLNSQI